ncbi:MAG: ATP-dependent sacrificial sulfur transferase LarE [Methanophagales archaeon]|nr:ATP-dependent sacrificial sulfur transferase LarE [Methanophagales archaeon]
MHKLEKLKQKIAQKENILIAFSGGVDSGLLTKVAYDVLGEKALAVTLDSETLPRSELEHAKKFVKAIGIKHMIIPSSELQNEEFVKNPLNRCYYCKKESARILKQIAAGKEMECIADGVNLSDYDEYRPGIKACDEEGIWHPFVEVGITKSDIRGISKDLGLSFWTKPSSACLSSRIPYGERITGEKLKMIEDAEEVLKSLGFSQIRVRKHGDIARIELVEEEMKKLLELKEKVIKELRGIGFDYITVDLEGYRSGSMDEIIHE